jgi:hypothetical protein
MADVRFEEPQRRTLGLLIAAGVVAVITVVLVATIGIARPPALEPVDAATRPDRSVAMFGWRDEGSCLDVIAPDGTLRTVRCGLGEYGSPLVWDERGIGLLRYGPTGEGLVILDPDDGVVVERIVLAETALRSGMSSVGLAATERDGGVLLVRDPDGRIVWQVTSPETYRIGASALDPVSGRLVLLDSARRLLVLEPGASAPRIWVADVGTEYAELLWEGTDLLAE